MRKYVIFSLLAILLSFIPESVMAQSKREAIVSGIVKDSLTNEGDVKNAQSQTMQMNSIFMGN